MTGLSFSIRDRMAARPRLRRRLAFVTLLLLAGAFWFSAVPGLAYYRFVTALRAGGDAESLRLDRYAAVVQAHAIEGLSSDVSGLTYSPDTGTLFAVTSRPAQIAELSTTGRLLRRIALKGVSDPEGITHVDGGRFVISDEGNQSLYWITIEKDTRTVAVDGAERLRLNLGEPRNMGFEGLSWDSERHRLYITEEMFPARVIVVEGLSRDRRDAGLSLDIHQWRPRGLAGAFMLDLSSATLHERTGNLLLLSHMSSLLVEFGADGEVLSFLPLWRGLRGLERSVGQAEGVAIGPDGDVFIVSEPNLFYRYSRREGPALPPARAEGAPGL